VLDAPLQLNVDDNTDHIVAQRSVQRAALDLQRIVTLIAQRYFRPGRITPRHCGLAPTWRLLLDIEEQAFTDLGFQGRHSAAVREGFLRIADNELTGADLDEPVDWQRYGDAMPTVFEILRGLVRKLSSERVNQRGLPDRIGHCQ